MAFRKEVGVNNILADQPFSIFTMSIKVTMLIEFSS